MTYWYVPMMYYPYWCVSRGTATNADSDTDMGDLSYREFRQYFPGAFPITQEEYDSRSIKELCDDE